MNRFTTAAMFLILMLCLVGCSDSGPRKYHYQGTVTLDGDPVPAGVIVFEPDPLAGNTGPQGSAVIKDGKYNTRKSPGQGCVGGASIVKIDCYDGKNPTEITPYGKRIRSRYEMKHELPAESGEVDFDVP